VRSVYIDTKDKERAECSKGVEVGEGQFVPLTEEAIEAFIHRAPCGILGARLTGQSAR